MYKKFKPADVIMIVLAFACLIYSKFTFFSGSPEAAIFIGLWVPSILAFGIYLKVIKNSKS